MLRRGGLIALALTAGLLGAPAAALGQGRLVVGDGDGRIEIAAGRGLVQLLGRGGGLAAPVTRLPRRGPPVIPLDRRQPRGAPTLAPPDQDRGSGAGGPQRFRNFARGAPGSR
jgi:hypothetical protein